MICLEILIEEHQETPKVARVDVRCKEDRFRATKQELEARRVLLDALVGAVHRECESEKVIGAQFVVFDPPAGMTS